MFLKMLLQRAWTVNWKKWAAKQEGIWPEPLALLRKKTKGDWTEKHRNVARKLVLEGGWVQQRLFDIGWSDKSECQACHKEKGTEQHRLYHCPEWHESRRKIPCLSRKVKPCTSQISRGSSFHQPERCLSVGQLDYDEEMGPLHGMYGSARWKQNMRSSALSMGQS